MHRRNMLAAALASAGAIVSTAFAASRAHAATPRRQFTVYTVGDRTAEVAREAGFTEVTSAEGDGAALAKLVMAERKPGDGFAQSTRP